jgi:hypothetical protein
METTDLAKLALSLSTDSRRILYEENKHRFTKVAFDVFQLNGSPVESLWVLEDGDDGKQYLAAMYEEMVAENKMESKGNWETILDKKSENLTLLYKDVPIKRFASSAYGFTKDDVHIFQRTLIEKLNSDKEFVNLLIKSQPKTTQDELFKKFPELS